MSTRGGSSVTLRLVVDIETNGLLVPSSKAKALDKIHCLGVLNLDTGEERHYSDHPEYPSNTGSLVEGFQYLQEADELIGHNWISFDDKAVRKIFPWWQPKDGCRVYDTLVASKIAWPKDTLWKIDEKLFKTGRIPGNMRGRYGLEAFGYRLGEAKGSYGKDTDWQTWEPAMSDYMMQDLRVTEKLRRKIDEKQIPDAVFELEMEVAEIMFLQEQAGFWFDHTAALKLVAELQNEQAALEERLRDHFPAWMSPTLVARVDPKTGADMKDHSGRALTAVKVEVTKTTRAVKRTEFPEVTIKRFSEKTGKELKPYVGPPQEHHLTGAEFCPVSFTEFNPSSRAHIANRLMKLYGWKPTEFTPDGSAKVDETVLKALPYPPCRDLVRYFVVTKILGYLAHGGQAWLGNYNEATGRIHGRVDALGTVTGRATHSNPNLGQVPSVQKGPDGILAGFDGGYGHECRSLFGASPGWELCGSDASGLELRCLAHFMAPYDGGEYGKVVTEGDVHTLNQNAAGLRTRDSAKTMIYALL